MARLQVTEAMRPWLVANGVEFTESVSYAAIRPHLTKEKSLDILKTSNFYFPERIPLPESEFQKKLKARSAERRY
jgi:hypothetical protein